MAALSACAADYGLPPPAPDCVVLDQPLRGGGEQFNILKSGRYCLGKNMSTRLDFADHAEQSFLISIDADNVDLDLRGHTLDRGSNRRPPGAWGIVIRGKKYISDPGSRNITIRNGTLRGFGVGILGLLDCKRTDCDTAQITYDAATHTYHYAPDNITVQNVKFDNVIYKIRFSDGRAQRAVQVAGDRKP